MNKDTSGVLTSGPTVRQEIERYSHMKVWEYTTTLYDKNHHLIDDGIDLETDKLYWESFIDSKQAAELERRLALIESESYQQDEEFTQMKEPE